MSEEGFPCDEYFPGNGCHLPMPPGHYGGTPGGDDSIEIKLPEDLDIPAILKPFLAGKLENHVSITDGSNVEIVCADAEIQIDA